MAGMFGLKDISAQQIPSGGAAHRVLTRFIVLVDLDGDQFWSRASPPGLRGNECRAYHVEHVEILGGEPIGQMAMVHGKVSECRTSHELAGMGSPMRAARAFPQERQWAHVEAGCTGMGVFVGDRWPGWDHLP
ncbi:hypothetical protein EDB83DRAFT_2319910 [Lactarius deliciosus]|nr:hypothetical protein EDB83DRAFT_2319910 [Lactarius deliciosus]